MIKQKVTKIILLIFTLIVLLAMLPACKSATTETTGAAAETTAAATTAAETETTAAATTVPEKKEITIGGVWITATNPFHVQWIEAAKKAADAYGVNLIALNGEGASEKQVAAIENLITQKVDVIMCDPADAKAIVPAIEEAKAAGITFIAMNNNVEAADISGTIDNYNNCFAIGQVLGTYFNGKADVCYLGGQPGSEGGQQREDGFMDALKEFPDVKVLSSLPTDWDPAKAQKIMEDWLVTYPKIDAIGSATDTTTLPAYETAKNAGRTEMKYFSYDGMEEAMALYSDDTWVADILTGADRFGWWFVQLAYRSAVLGESLDKIVNLPTPLILSDATVEKCKANGLSEVNYVTPEEALKQLKDGGIAFGPDSLNQ